MIEKNGDPGVIRTRDPQIRNEGFCDSPCVTRLSSVSLIGYFSSAFITPLPLRSCSFRLRAYYVLTSRRQRLVARGGRKRIYMAAASITKRAVDAAKARKTDSYLWDRELPGFGLKVTPAGRKVYLVQYRLGGRKGRTRRVTIGQHGPMTPTFAGLKPSACLATLPLGVIPQAERDKAKADKSLAVVLEQFMAEHVRPKLKPDREGISADCEALRPAAAWTPPIGEFKRQDIARLHHELSDKPYQANRTLALLSKFFGWAEKHGLRPDGSNPCRHVEKYREGRRERFLSQAELGRLGDALREAEQDKSCSPWIIAAIRLLTLTGARRNEILTLRWEHVSEEHGCLLLPDSQDGPEGCSLEPARTGIAANHSPARGQSLRDLRGEGRDGISSTLRSPGVASVRQPSLMT